MRVLFVDHETRLSGGEQDLVDLVRALPASVDAHCALPGAGPLTEALTGLGVTVHSIRMADDLRAVSRRDLEGLPAPAELRGAGRASWDLGRLARRLRPDVVHTNSMKAHLLALPARPGGPPLVWHVRDILEPGRVRSAFGAAARWGPDRVVCLSEATARQFGSPAVQRKTRVVYNGIRLRPPDPAAVEAFRARTGAGPDDVLVAMVGQIAHWKGQDLFVEAAGRLAAADPRLRFAVVGECLFPRNEGAFERTVRDRATSLGLEGRLHWAGWVNPVEPVMHGLDVLVHQSRLPEPFGRVMVEALAAGNPVVASTLGAGPEIVTEGVGRLVAPGDIDGLVTAVTELVGLARTPATAAAARARAACFDIARTGAGVLGVWAELVDTSSATGPSRAGPN